VSELDVENGSLECVDVLDEMLILGVSMDIRDARSETLDIESEVDVPNDETSNSAEAMHCQKCCHWLVWQYSASFWSITVCIIGVGILLTSDHKWV
jgi:hypothetical protein